MCNKTAKTAAMQRREGERDISDLTTILATFPHNINVSFQSLQHLSEHNLVTLKTEAHFSSEISERNYANDPTRCLNSEVYKSLFNYTHQHMHTYMLFKKSNIYIKTLKTLLHVSNTRSSSGSIHCSLLKL